MKFNKSDYRLAITISVIYALLHQIFRYLDGLNSSRDWGVAWTNLKFFPDFLTYLGIGFLIGLGIAYIMDKPDLKEKTGDK